MAVKGTITANVVARTGNFQRGMANVRKSLARVANRAVRLADSFMRMGAVAGIAAAGMAIKLGAEAEATELRLAQLTGSTEKAKKIWEDIREFGSATPFQVTDLAEAAQLLLAFGTSAEQVMPELMGLTDIAAGTGASISRLAEILGQSSAEGVVQLERLTMFASRKIPILAAITEKTAGLSGMALKKWVSEGNMSADMVKEIFTEMTEAGGVFYKAAERRSKTLEGRWSTLVDKAAELGRSIGTNLLPVAMAAVSLFTRWTDTLNNLDGAVVKTIGNYIKWAIGIYGVVKAVQIAVIVYTKLKIILNVTNKMAIVSGFLMGPKNWAIMAAGAVAAAGALIVYNRAMDDLGSALMKESENHKIMKEEIDDTRKAYKKWTDEQIAGVGTGKRLSAEQKKRDADAVKEKKKLIDQQRAWGASLRKNVMTPTEQYTAQITKLDQALAGNFISMQTYQRAAKKYREEMSGAFDLDKQTFATANIRGTMSGQSGTLTAQANTRNYQKKQETIANQSLTQLQMINRNTGPDGSGYGIIEARI